MNRDDLAVGHLHLASDAVYWARMKWPAADRHDLVSWANEALLVAARTWDPDRGMTFTGYARIKIRFALIDRWRSETCRGKRGRHEFTFDHAAIEIDQEDGDWGPHPAIVAACASFDSRLEAVEDAAAASSIIEGLALTERERYVVVELGSGTTLRQIGAALGVSESRVCQIRQAIYDRLCRAA